MNKSKEVSIVVATVFVALAFFVHDTELFREVDLYIFDRQMRFLSAQLPVDEDIIVIAIDDYSLTAMQTIAGKWAWPRSVYAQLIESLIPHSPQAVVFDILLAEKDIYRPDSDSYLNEVLAESSHVYFSVLEQRGEKNQGLSLAQLAKALALNKTAKAKPQARAQLILPWALDSENWQVGAINFDYDFDGVGRRYQLSRDIQGWQLASLPAKVLTDLGINMPNESSIYLQWQGHHEKPYKTLAFADVFQAISTNNQTYLSQFHGKIILIGATASGLFDARATPINNHLPGVYILATAMDNLKNGSYLLASASYIPLSISAVFILAITSCFFAASGYSRQLMFGFSILAMGALVLLLISNGLLSKQQVMFIGQSLVMASATFIVFTFIYGYRQYQQRQAALRMFGRFLDPQVVLSLLKEDALTPEQLNKKQTLTVLFSDIRNFTQLAEQYEAKQVVQLLNQYFNAQVDIIFKHGGTLDKFIGDCVMAFWGAPLPVEEHAVKAINTALDMQERLIDFKKTLPEHLKHFDIGIGIHSGECIVGMIGAERRIDYTVIGDAVNLASRIEGLTKSRARILVSEQTKQLAEHDFDYEYCGEHQVKGRHAKVKLYQPKRRQR